MKSFPCFERVPAGATDKSILPATGTSQSRRQNLQALSLTFRLLAFLSIFTVASVTAPAQGPAKTTLIIKSAKGATPAQVQAAISGNAGTLKRSIPKLDLHVIEVPAAAAEAITRNLKANAAVVRVEASRTRKRQGLPSDPMFASQWALPKIGWDLVYGFATPAYWTKVAILDTGVDGNNADLVGKLATGTSIIDGSNGLTDESGHGTWLAGVVAANTNNAQGIAGVAFDFVQVMPVKVLTADGLGNDGDIIAGLIWAADNGASVILMAFSSPGFSESLQEAIDYAWARNIVLVSAAGNDSSGDSTFPAGDRGVIGVSATDQNDSLLSFSNFGPSVFLAGPGVNILGTQLNNGFGAASGTSASAAIVAGAAALMRAINPTIPNGVVVSRLARNADPAGTQAASGNGRVQLERAISDTNTDSIQPAGSAPIGGGGPFVGPYRAAAGTATATISPSSVNISTVTSFTLVVTNTSGGNTIGSITIAIPADVTISGTPSVTVTGKSWIYDAANSNSSAMKFRGTANTEEFDSPAAASISFSASTSTALSKTFTTTATKKIDYTGGAQTIASQPVVTVTAPVTTTTAVTSSVNPSTYGQSVTFTATVTSTSTPTGSVNFVIGGGSPVAGTAGATTGTTATWTYTTSALTAATHTVSASYVPTGSFTASSGSLSGGQVVNKATPTATLAVNNSPQTYTGSGQAATVAISLSSVPGTVTNILTGGAATQTNVGTYAVTANFVPNDTANYHTLTALSAGNFTISQKAASVSPVAAGKTYGDADPALTGSLSGFILADAVTAVYSRTVGDTVLGSPYTISAVLNPAGVLSNYAITYNTALFTINRKTVTATVTANDKTYDGNATASIATCVAAALQPGDVVTCSAGSATFAGVNVVGAQTVTATGITLGGAAANNYVLSSLTATATAAITVKPITVAATAGQT